MQTPSKNEAEIEMEEHDEENVFASFTDTIRALAVDKGKHPVHSYAQLCALATSHRKIRSYSWLDRWDLLFKFKDTVLESLIDEPVFYVSLITYIVSRVCMELNVTNTNDQYLIAVSSVGTVLSFMFVFTFTTQYNRYMSALQLAMKNAGFIQDIIYQCRGYLTKKETNLIVRYANAANFAAYTGLSEYHTVENFFLPSIKKYNLLTKAELDILLTYDLSNSGMSGCKVLIAWMTDVIRSSPKCENPSNWLIRAPTTLREYFSDQFFFVAFSTPFIYLHFTYVCIVIYLPIFSFALARQVVSKRLGTLDFFNLLAIIMLCIFFLGLYKLSRDFQDPYGLDFVDIPIVEICNQTAVESFRVAAIVDAKDVSNRKVNASDSDVKLSELGPGIWNSDSIYLNDDEEPDPTLEENVSSKVKRQLKRQVAELKKRSKAMPSFM